MTLEEEIEQLKKELNFLKSEPEPPPERMFKVPKGTTGRCERGTRGRCVVCDKECEPEDCIRRCCWDEIVVIKGEKKVITKGYRVCYWCSPTVRDWVLERYNVTIDHWPHRWKSYKDTGTYSRNPNVFAKTGIDTSVSRLEELLSLPESLNEQIERLRGEIDGA